ncbi:MAG: MBOAT family protein [Firmicutes bacterium]|nr:MBOAT family protein [Bacillota bacterium]
MSLTSPLFFLFLVFTLLIYFTLPRRYQWFVLLAASYLFYATGGIKLTFCLLLTTITTFFAGLLLTRLEKKNHKKLVLALVLLFNFGLLAFLKYYNFAAAGLNIFLANAGYTLPTFSLLLPLGISFYTFQSAGYLIDLYRGKYRAETNLAKFALFVSFFPQVIQGPISRFDQLAPQLTAPHDLDYDRLKYGIQLMLWGYFKKIIIADRAVVVVNKVIDNFAAYPGSLIAIAVFFYCLQIYCDFSGGIDIVRGAAQMLGINLRENFRRPYFATSLADFWRRWHLSLGDWMRDYLFFPLSLSKPFYKLGKKTRKLFKGKLGKIIPTSLASFIVFFTIGIWHGANLKYIAFGIYNGLIISFSIVIEPYWNRLLQKLGINPEGRFWLVVQVLNTNLLVFCGRYFTRAASLGAALQMLKKTFFSFQPNAVSVQALLNLGLTKTDYLIVLLGSLVILGVGFAQEKGKAIRKTLEQKNWAVQWSLLMAMLLVLVFFGIYRQGFIASEFIYQQF